MNNGERKLRTLNDVPLDGKRVIVRVDFNVTGGKSGSIGPEEDYRIETALPTIQELQRRRCKVLLLSHRGRPHDPGVKPEETNMEPVKARLEELMHEEVRMLSHLYGPDVEAVVAGMEPGSVALFPNVRLDDREELGSEKFAQELAASADAFVNEAFSVAHRAHTSVSYIPMLLPSAAGHRVVIEVAALSKLQKDIPRPYVAIASGSKISTKVGMLRRLLAEVDTLCVGGQIGNVFLVAKQQWITDRYSADEVAVAKTLLDEFEEKLVIPTDVVIGTKEGRDVQMLYAHEVPADVEGVWDIGRASAERIIEVCQQAKTIMWNGPVGKFETEAYADATKKVALALADINAYRVVGGGDTVNVLEKYKVASKYDHVSVGGGAMIAFLEGKRMPGLEPLYE